MYNNINIISNDGNVYKYVAEMKETSRSDIFYKYFDGSYIINNEKTVPLKRNNMVSEIVADETILMDVAEVRLYAPQYNMELFDQAVKYLIVCYMKYNEKRLILHSGIHDFIDAKANDKIFKKLETTYYEYIDFQIPAPASILYDDDCKELRAELEDVVAENEINNQSCILSIEVTPLSDDYKIHDYFNVGYTALNLEEDVQDMDVYLRTTTEYSTETPQFYLEWKWNGAYDSLCNYIYETYGLNEFNIKANVMVADRDRNVFIEAEETFEYNDVDKIMYFSPSLIKFDSWKDFKDGNLIWALLELQNPEDDEILMSIPVKPLELTQEVFRYYVGDLAIYNIQLSKQDMNNYNFSLVNKIQKNVIQLDRPKDYKANIIKPVFYKVKDIANIIVNPQVTENICINLDPYKQYAEVFYIQIEGVIFNEIGRTGAGVVFKIIGNNLANETKEGTYYILDDRKELITSGKYTYNY